MLPTKQLLWSTLLLLWSLEIQRRVWLSRNCDDVSSFLSPPPVLVHRTDLLLLFLPIFLVSTLQQEPHLKVRNFRKTASRGIEMARNFRVEAKDRVGQEGFGDLNGEQIPNWDCQRPIEQVLPTSRPVVGVLPSTPSPRAASSPEPRNIPAASP